MFLFVVCFSRSQRWDPGMALPGQVLCYSATAPSLPLQCKLAYQVMGFSVMFKWYIFKYTTPEHILEYFTKLTTLKRMESVIKLASRTGRIQQHSNNNSTTQLKVDKILNVELLQRRQMSRKHKRNILLIFVWEMEVKTREKSP